MNGRAQIGTALILALAWLGVLASPAYAYIDPGTGAYAFQLAIAALLTVLVFVKSLWRRIVSIFRRHSDKHRGD